MQYSRILLILLLLTGFLFAANYDMGPYSEGQTFYIENKAVQIKTLVIKAVYSSQINMCGYDSEQTYVDLITPEGFRGNLHVGESTTFNVKESSTNTDVPITVMVSNVAATYTQQGNPVTCTASNKKVTFVVIIPSPGSNSGYCTDPDASESQGGIFIKTTISQVGTITSSKTSSTAINLIANTASPATDTCYLNGNVASGGQIRERFCSVTDNNQIRSNTVDCPANYQCNDGACKEITYTCTDNDGDNKNIASSVIERQYVGGILNTSTTKNDFCIDLDGGNGDLGEYLCNTDGKGYVGPRSCAPGNCQNGACVGAAQEMEEFCSGTQEGSLDPAVKGGVINGTRPVGGIGEGQIQEDVCTANDRVKEFFCRGTTADSITNFCPNGKQCQDGACMTIGNVPFCSDSDNGDDKLVKGTINYGVLDADGDAIQNTTLIDSCTATGKVLEYYCNGNAKVEHEVDCSSGQICSNGACVVSQVNNGITCQDSDDLNIYTKGENIARVSNILETKSDYCIDQKTITEYYCSNGERRMQQKQCPIDYVCQNGLCSRTNVLQPTKTVEIDLNRGWNLFSIPLKDATITTDCSGFDTRKKWHYDRVVKWISVDKFEAGKGYWFKADTSCKITVKGVPYVLDDLKKKHTDKRLEPDRQHRITN